MRKLVLQMSVSVDGFVAGADGESSWIFNTIDDAANEWALAGIWKAEAHLMGRKTFHDMSAYWPYATDEFAAPMNIIPKVVFTHDKSFDPSKPGKTTQSYADAPKVNMKKEADPEVLKSWQHAKVAAGDLKDEINALKNQAGKMIMAHGGAGFAQNLISENLVDEYRLLVHPVILGKGLPIFSQLSRITELHHISTVVFKGGCLGNVYSK